jgi:hypothetical protein
LKRFESIENTLSVIDILHRSRYSKLDNSTGKGPVVTLPLTKKVEELNMSDLRGSVGAFEFTPKKAYSELQGGKFTSRSSNMDSSPDAKFRPPSLSDIFGEIGQSQKKTPRVETQREPAEMGERSISSAQALEGWWRTRLSGAWHRRILGRWTGGVVPSCGQRHSKTPYRLETPFQLASESTEWMSRHCLRG